MQEIDCYVTPKVHGLVLKNGSTCSDWGRIEDSDQLRKLTKNLRWRNVHRDVQKEACIQNKTPQQFSVRVYSILHKWHELWYKNIAEDGDIMVYI